MKVGWEVKTLGDIADVKGGKRVPKGYKLQSEPTKHPYITVSDFTDDGTIDTSNIRYVSSEVFDQIKRYTISSNNLYLSIAGTIGKTGYVPSELDGASLTENACKLVLRPGIDRDFIYYFTKSDDFTRQAGTNTRIAAQPKLALERLKTIKLPIPSSLPEQRRIVGLLDEAFESIATAKANAEKNLQNARALFESHLQSVFTQRGEGWVEKKFEDVCQKITDGTHHSPQTQFTERGLGRFPYITSKNIRNNFMDLSNVAYIERAFHDEVYARCHPSLGDVLLTKDGANTGNVTINILDEPFSLLSSVCLIKTNQAVLKPAFLCYYLQSSTGLSSIVGQMTGAAIKRIVLKDIKNAVVPFPPLKEQDSIVATLNLLLAETQRLESIYQQKLAALEALKKSLLHQAFTGAL